MRGEGGADHAQPIRPSSRRGDMPRVNIHLPARLEAAVNAFAASRGISRSRAVVLALERHLGAADDERLDVVLAREFQPLDPAAAKAIDAVLDDP